MKILLTVDPEIPVPPRLYGGIERVVDMIITQFVRLGHEVALVAHRDSTASARLFPWPRMHSQAKADTLANTAALVAAVARFAPDVIHSFSRLAYMLPLFASSTPKLMSYQRLPTPRGIRWSARAARNLQFTGCSRWIADLGAKAGGRWSAIPNGVDLGTYPFVPAVPDDAPLVFLSRLERIKGAHTAIAIAKAAGRKLVLAGNRLEQGEGARYFATEIEPHLEAGRVEWVGPVDDVQKAKLLGGAAAMLVPIEWEEPFGIVFAEALACGAPVISTPRGAVPEIVRHGIDGFHVQSVEEGAAAVGKLSTIDRRACRARAESSFSAEVIANEYVDLYRAMARG